MAGRGIRVSHPRKWRKKVQAPAGNGDTFAPREPHVSVQPWTLLPSRCVVLAGLLTRQPGWRRSGMLWRRADQMEAWGLPLFRQALIGLESGFCLDRDRRAVFTSYVSRDTAEATRLGESERMLICVA